MPRGRRDPILGEWVVLAPERAARPSDLAPNLHANPGPGPVADSNAAPGASAREPAIRVGCPFCEGAEADTPPEWFAIPRPGCDPRSPDRPGWSVRVVPNKYPAVAPDGRGRARGSHHVVVESPRHVVGWADMDESAVLDVFRAYREIVRRHRETPGVAQTALFKNVGRDAGASLAHAHAQALGLALPTPAARALARRAREHRRETGRGLFETAVADELDRGTGVVARVAGLLAYCPAASRFPREIRVVPEGPDPAPAFDRLDDDAIRALARLARGVAASLDRRCGRPAANFVLLAPPFDARPDDPDARWLFRVMPRLAGIAGLELGHGLNLNTLPPETAARDYREDLARELNAPARSESRP